MEEKIDRRKFNGGARPGAGKPKGKKNIVNFKRALKEYISPEELKHMVERAKKFAKTDKKMLMFLLEQVFGKAKTTNQTIQDGAKTNNIAIFLDTLEKKKLNAGSEITGQIVEAEVLVPDQGQGTEEGSIQPE